MSSSRLPPKVAFLPYPKPCVVCGRPTRTQHHKIAYALFRKRRFKGNPNRQSNVCPLCTYPEYVDSCHEVLDSCLGQQPYSGTDRTKRQALGHNVAKLLARDERFIRALPAYIRKAYREYGGTNADVSRD